MTGPGLQMYLIFYSSSSVVEDSFQVWEVRFKLIGIVSRIVVIDLVAINPFDHRLPSDPLEYLLRSYLLMTSIDQQKGEAFELFVDPWISFVVLFEG